MVVAAGVDILKLERLIIAAFRVGTLNRKPSISLAAFSV